MSGFRKPKFHLFSNTQYALEGLWEVFRNETPFKIEVILFFILSFVTIMLPIMTTYKMILIIVMFIPLMAELTNSAIERIVDLASPDYHDMAKKAKDAASAVVFVSLTMTACVWGSVLYLAFS